MPEYGRRSKEQLSTCHPLLQELFSEVVRHFDNSILEGHRGQERQNQLRRMGKSKLHFPLSNHNKLPSMAVDAIPYPIDWADEKRMCLFAGFVKGVALKMGILIRWGGDWDGDTQLKDNKFNDYPHFELLKPEKVDGKITVP